MLVIMTSFPFATLATTICKTGITHENQTDPDGLARFPKAIATFLPAVCEFRRIP
jgi:hypothetical protein